MERCVDKLECICNFCYCLGILLLCLNNIKEFFVKVTAYDFKQAFFFCFVKRNKLNIVKYIVEAHGGTVTARNDHGLGFEIGLPCEEAL